MSGFQSSIPAAPGGYSTADLEAELERRKKESVEQNPWPFIAEGGMVKDAAGEVVANCHARDRWRWDVNARILSCGPDGIELAHGVLSSILIPHPKGIKEQARDLLKKAGILK